MSWVKSFGKVAIISGLVTGMLAGTAWLIKNVFVPGLNWLLEDPVRMIVVMVVAALAIGTVSVHHNDYD